MSERPDERRESFVMPVILALMALGMYVGAYYATVSVGWPTRAVIPGPVELPPRYAGPPRVAAILATSFAPIHWIDRKLRRDRWEIIFSNFD